MQTKTSGNKKHKRRIVALMIVLALVVALGATFFVYTGVYYHADEQVWQFAQGYEVRVEQRDGYLWLTPETGTAAVGYAFYPGGKVQAEAYLPYLAEVAAQGYACALLQVPFRLAIFDTGAAAAPIAENPDIAVWAVGGHSLGGVAAASYAAKAPAEVQGLVLLAAYSTQDLTQSGLTVVSVTATQDEVLNWEKYEEAKTNLPADAQYVSIQGGNHGQFGMYGPQKGDGMAAIPGEEQRAEVAAVTVALLARLAAQRQV